MRKSEIVTLLAAHQGRARTVASLHVLRQPKLEPDDHAFLLEHESELGPSDLLRWRSRSEQGSTLPVIRVIARRAAEDPVTFQHEILGAPRLDLDDDEWRELADQLNGKVPAAVYALLLARGGERPPRPQSVGTFTPRNVAPPDLRPSDLPPFDFEHGPPWDALTTRQIFDGIRAGRIDLDERALAGLVMQRARSGTEDWSVLVCEFPAGLQDAVIEKTRRSLRGNERANLLLWLEAQGASRAALLSLALEREGVGHASLALMSWVVKQLSSRAAWEKHGPEIFHKLLVQRAFADLADLATLAFSDASKEGEDPPKALVESIQAAFALALIRIAREAIAASSTPRAMAALSALACLDPPSRVSAAVHELRRAPNTPAEVLELLAVNERLVKHSAATEASLEGTIAAVHVVADAL